MLENKSIFKKFIEDDVYNNEITYRFFFVTGDIFVVKYDGEGESELNPITGEEDEYYGFVFYIIDVEKDVSGNYCKDGFVEISKYNFPIKIEKI